MKYNIVRNGKDLQRFKKQSHAYRAMMKRSAAKFATAKGGICHGK